LINSSNDVNALINTNRPIILGAYIRSDNTYGYNYSGKIDEVQIYDAAILGAQIQQNYLAGINNLYIKELISEIEYNQRMKELASNK